MAAARTAKAKINTSPTQLRPNLVLARPLAAQKAALRAGSAGGRSCGSADGSGRVVVEVGVGIVVYPPEEEGVPWRAVFTENGQRRYRQAMTEAGLAVRLDKVIERLAAGAPNMERPGADLISHYLDPAGSRSPGRGHAGTPTPSGGCATGSSPRSSPR